jgi:hypothetical protein
MNGPSAPASPEWLNLSAAPIFAAMALVSAAIAGGPTDALCAPTRGWPIDGMVVMYLLMCALHVTPWLKRLSERRPVENHSVEEESECSLRQTL